MAIDPKRIAGQVALRTLQLTGTSQAILEASYTAADLSQVMDGAELPFTALRDAVLSSEAKIAHLIGMDKLNPYRLDLYGKSDDILSGEEVPALSEDGFEFVGVFSQVTSTSDDLPLTEQPIHVIRRFLRGNYTTTIYNYALHSARIYHTRDAGGGVYFEGVVFSREQAELRFEDDATEISPIPTALEGLWIADTIANLASEGWLLNESAHYQQIANQGVQMLRNRETTMPILPTATATAEPAVG